MRARFGRRTSVDDVGERHLDAGVINQALSRFVFHVLLCDEQGIGDALFMPFHHARLRQEKKHDRDDQTRTISEEIIILHIFEKVEKLCKVVLLVIP